MKQIPFDLSRALAGDKVVTGDGHEVTQLHKFDCENDCLAGVLKNTTKTWRVNGRYTKHGETCLDLFMAPKTVKRWVNFYDNGAIFTCKSEKEAKQWVYGGRAIAIAVPVEFEEGYGCE